MGQVNAVNAGVGGVEGSQERADIGLIARRDNSPKTGATEIGKGRVQGVGPDGKTVYTTTLVVRGDQGRTRFFANGKQLPPSITTAEAARTFVRQQIAKGTLGQLARGDQNAFTQSAPASAATQPALVRIDLGDPHPARLTEWLTGGAIKTALPENHGAREVARSAGVAFSKDGRSLNLPNDALGGQLFAQMQYTRWQRNSPHPMEWGPLIPKPVGMSAPFVAGFKAEWARMNNQGLRDLGGETLANLGSAVIGGRSAGRSGQRVGGAAAAARSGPLTPTVAVENVRASLSKFERAPSGTNAAELNAALVEANALIKGQANRASLPEGLVKQYANLTTQAQNSLRNALRGGEAAAPVQAKKPTVNSPRGQPVAQWPTVTAPRAVPRVTPLPTLQPRKAVPRVTPLPTVSPARKAIGAPAEAASGSSAPPGLQRFERRPGESMSDYLARHNVAQSLTPQQQRIADEHQLRMSATPPRPGPSPRRPLDAVSLALKMRNFGDSASAIANPRTYDTFLNLLDQQRVTDVVRIGNTNATEFIAETLAGRTQEFRDAGVHSLTREFGGYLSPQMASASGGMNGGMAHEAHTAFGAVSKLGEVHASSRAFNNSTQSWASRGLLPGQGGQTVAQFWKPDFPLEWVNADQALTSLADAGPQMTVQTFADSTIETLRNTGFIPKGSALAARLERLEMAIAKREMLQTKLNTVDPAQLPALQGQLRAAITTVQQGLDDFANRATQSRGELLMQSLGTPKTTYELTIRHATAARYMQSIEGQRDAVFSAPKFKALMAEVKAEAGPEAEVSLRWHRALIETYGANAEFQGAMRNSLPMRQAWAAYKAQYGL